VVTDATTLGERGRFDRRRPVGCPLRTPGRRALPARGGRRSPTRRTGSPMALGPRPIRHTASPNVPATPHNDLFAQWRHILNVL